MNLEQLLTLSKEELLENIKNNKAVVSVEARPESSFAEITLLANYSDYDCDVEDVKKAFNVYLRKCYNATIKEVYKRYSRDRHNRLNVIITVEFEK